MNDHYRSDPSKGCGILLAAGLGLVVLVVIALLIWWLTS